jgi:hypothetical protein
MIWQEVFEVFMEGYAFQEDLKVFNVCFEDVLADAIVF